MNPSVHTDDARFLELLERWISGEFTRSDERELRALTEADAFRREAWEGFSSLPETAHQVYLERLRQRLRPASGGRRVPFGMWAAAAAVFLLLLAAVYFLPRITSEQTNPVAQTSEAEKAPQPVTVPEPAASDLAQHDEAKGLEPALRTKPAAPLSNREDEVAADAIASGNENTDAGKRLEEWAANPEILPTQAPPVATGAPRQYTDTATPVRVGGPDIALQTQFPETIPLGGPAANMNMSREAAGKAKKSRPQTAAEPALPGKTDTFSAESQAREAAGQRIAGPVGGWDAFHDFMRRNARLTEAARNNNISGAVQLEFTIDREGKPVNIQVIHPLGFGCDEEAKRLLGLFVWSPPGSGPVLVEIPFVR